MSTLTAYCNACINNEGDQIPPAPAGGICTATPKAVQGRQHDSTSSLKACVEKAVDSWDPQKEDAKTFLIDLQNALTMGMINPDELSIRVGIFSTIAKAHKEECEEKQKLYKLLMEALKIDKWLEKFDDYIRMLDALISQYQDDINQIDAEIVDIELDIRNIDDFLAIINNGIVDTLGEDELRELIAMNGLDPDDYINADGELDKDKLKQDLNRNRSDLEAQREEKLRQRAEIEQRMEAAKQLRQKIKELRGNGEAYDANGNLTDAAIDQLTQALEQAGIDASQLDLAAMDERSLMQALRTAHKDASSSADKDSLDNEAALALIELKIEAKRLQAEGLEGQELQVKLREYNEQQNRSDQVIEMLEKNPEFNALILNAPTGQQTGMQITI